MEYSFWKSRWDARQIGFHQAKPNAHLQKNIERLKERFGNRVFVPLAGKTKDIVFLLNQQCKVIAVEFVQDAILEFFQENDIPYSVTPESQAGTGVCYEAKNLKFYAADALQDSPPWANQFDWVFDRAALVALDAKRRKQYAKRITQATRAGGGQLLIAFHYNPEAMQGPPFSVSNEEVQKLYGEDWEISLVESVNLMEKSPFAKGNPNAKVFEENVFILKKQ
ncbi:MAG: hypothetical protein D6767_02395 [Candidatus Hydrogenedentota bacterium]|nr:MAG: hypothetical protein D6767_02395 [Candidatus Hydrogenedentota bacterium]